MGVSSKSSSSTTNTNNTSTSTPNVPTWGVDALQGLNGQIEGIANTDPSTFVAPASTLQNQAFTGATDLTGGWQPTNAMATGLAEGTADTAAPTTSAATAYGGIANYLNPETDAVVNTTLANFDKQAGQTTAQQEAAGALNGAFGGSRFGLQQGETAADLDAQRAQTEAQLRSSAYTDAESQAQQDANRQQTASDTNAQLSDDALNRNTTIANLLNTTANSANANNIADLTTQEGLGDDQRSITQAGATAPISLAQTVAQLLGQNQLPLLTGQTVNSSGTSNTNTTSTPSTISQIGQGIGGAVDLASLFVDPLEAASALGSSAASGGLGAFMSDCRLKRDIERVGTRPDGLGIYLFRYLWSPILYLGVMAQEVLKAKPEAVIQTPSGYLAVDYGAL